MSMHRTDDERLKASTDADAALVSSVENDARELARKNQELEDQKKKVRQAAQIKERALDEQIDGNDEVLEQYREVLSLSDEEEDDTPPEPERPGPQAVIDVLDVFGRRALLDASRSTGEGLSYEWETGEGGVNGYVRGEVRYAHTYADSDQNDFLVRLRVTDAQGRHSIAERQVTVEAVPRPAPEPEPRPEPEPDPVPEPEPQPAPRPRRHYDGRPRTLNEWLGAIVGGIIGLIVGLFTREFPPHITGVGLTVFAACWVFVLVGLGFYAGGSIAHNYDHEEDEE